VKVTGRKSVRAYDQAAADQADRRTAIEVMREGERVVLRTRQERAAGNVRISADLEITVPKDFAVEARGAGGDIDIRNLAGPALIDSDSGSVRIENAGGDVRVQTRRSELIRAVSVKGNFEVDSRGGDIELENIAGEVRIAGSYSGTLQFQNLAKPLIFESRQTELRAAALPGRITMDLSQLTGSRIVGPFRLVTKSRDVRLDDVTTGLEVDTERGDIEIRSLRTPLGRIEARSRSGNIQVSLPEKAVFQLDATTEKGAARNDFGPTIQVTTEGAAAAMKGGAGTGPVVKLSTERGTIAVRKAEALPLEELKL
jgi:DUF4097 and DUF4098 domain-containing protein YvlB